MSRFWFGMTIAGAGLIAACATVAEAEISQEAAEKLAQFERTGEKTDCLQLRRIDSIDPLDERHFLVRVGVRQYYLNEVSGGCFGAGDSFNRLQYTTTLTQLCKNEIIKVVDNVNGFTTGSCGLGEFERLEKKPKDATE